jgi:hypothetical protein
MAIPDTARRQLARRLDLHRQQRWPNLNELDIRFRGDFVYLTSTDFTGDPMPLCRLTYKKNPELWGLAIYLASHDAYENSILPNGRLTGTPEQALDCACGLYLNDPTAWT